MKTKNRVFATMLVFFLLFFVSGIVFGAGEQEKEAKQVLRVGQVGGLVSLEINRNAAPNYLFIENVFDQLLFNEKAKGEYEPEAAIDWELAPDNMSMTITLREGMVTHDGSKVDAEMLEYDFEERILQKDKGVATYNQASPYIDHVEVIDDLTFKVIFSNPAPHARDLMALVGVADPDMFIKDDGTVALGNEEDKQIGSGAFKAVEYVPGSHYHWEKFDDYWEEGAPKLDRIEITFFGDSASMIAALEAGEIDYAFNPPFEDMKRLKNNPNYTVWAPETKGVASILMVNPESEQLRDPKVRQAINYAINRNAINEAAYAGMATPTGVPAIKGSMGYTPELEIPLDGDPGKAKELLQEAGNPDISVKITYGSNNDIYRMIAEIVAEDLKAVGIDAKLDPVDHNVYVQKRTSQDFDILPSLLAGINKHPAGLQDSFVYAIRKDGLNDFFDDIEPQEPFLDYRENFNKGMAAGNTEEAAQYFKNALLAAKRGSWVLILAGQPFGAISSSDVKGVTWTEADKPVFKYTYIEE